MSHECKRCGETKATDEMCMRQGKPSKTCKACFAAAFTGRKKKSTTTLDEVVKRRTKPEPPPAPVVLGRALEIDPGFGVRARREDNRLSLEQDDADGNTDNIVLSRSEVRALVFEYAAWVGFEVTQVAP